MRRHPNRKSTGYNKKFLASVIADALEEKDRREFEKSKKINTVLKTNSKDILSVMGIIGVFLALIGPLYWMFYFLGRIELSSSWQSLAFSSFTMTVLGATLAVFSFKLASAIDTTNDVHLQTSLFSAVLSFIALITAILSFLISGSR